MSDAGEVVGFVVEAAVEVLGALGDAGEVFDSGPKRKTGRGAIITLAIVGTVVIGTVLLLVLGIG